MAKREDTRPSAAKQALPGARRGPSLYYMDPRELHIAGWDDDDRSHWSYNPSAHAPVDERLKRWIAETEGNFDPVLVVRDGDKVYVKDGRDRTKAMRELAVEAEKAGVDVLFVLCKADRGRDGEHFTHMVAANNCRKVDNPITRAELSMRALKFMDEEKAADLIGVKPAMMRQLHRLIDLCPELQAAVASGEVGIFKALTAYGKKVTEQKAMLEAWRNPPPKDKSAPRPPSKKKVYAVLGAAESWQQSGGSRDDLSVFLLRWFAGYETDDALAKRAPHLATDLKIATKKKAKVAT
jgi:hypothetical protein